MSEIEVAREMAALASASREVLIAGWRRFMKCEPPRYASIEFLRRAVTYALQERARGGLPTSAKRRLLAIARGEKVPEIASQIRVKPETRLLREWHGETHEVIVTDQGFVWEGRTYTSLSAVAQALSGAKWNGRRFFGLVPKHGRAHG